MKVFQNSNRQFLLPLRKNINFAHLRTHCVSHFDFINGLIFIHMQIVFLNFSLKSWKKKSSLQSSSKTKHVPLENPEHVIYSGMQQCAFSHHSCVSVQCMQLA